MPFFRVSSQALFGSSVIAANRQLDFYGGDCLHTPIYLSGPLNYWCIGPFLFLILLSRCLHIIERLPRASTADCAETAVGISRPSTGEEQKLRQHEQSSSIRAAGQARMADYEAAAQARLTCKIGRPIAIRAPVGGEANGIAPPAT